MKTGVVYQPIIDGVKSLIEIAFRGERQLLPNGSITFLDEEGLRVAFQTVTQVAGWEDDAIYSLPWGQIAGDVLPAIGWDWHPSQYQKEIRLPSGRRVVVYRKEINSCIL